jgi:hypothetical protein
MLRLAFKLAVCLRDSDRTHEQQPQAYPRRRIPASTITVKAYLPLPLPSRHTCLYHYRQGIPASTITVKAYLPPPLPSRHTCLHHYRQLGVKAYLPPPLPSRHTCLYHFRQGIPASTITVKTYLPLPLPSRHTCLHHYRQGIPASTITVKAYLPLPLPSRHTCLHHYRQDIPASTITVKAYLPLPLPSRHTCLHHYRQGIPDASITVKELKLIKQLVACVCETREPQPQARQTAWRCCLLACWSLIRPLVTVALSAHPMPAEVRKADPLELCVNGGPLKARSAAAGQPGL